MTIQNQQYRATDIISVDAVFHAGGMEDKRKQKYLLNVCVYMNKHILNKLEKNLMMIIIIVSVIITQHKFQIPYLHSKWI